MVTNKNLKLLAIALLLMNAGIASAAPTTTFVMQLPVICSLNCNFESPRITTLTPF